MKKYAIVTMTGEDGGAATYFNTEAEAVAAAKEKAANDWYELADLRRKHEEVYSCEVDEDGDETDYIDSIVSIPYIQKYVVAVGHGENVLQVEEFQTVDEPVEARTAFKAASEVFEQLDPADLKDIIFQVHPEESKEIEYFVEEDFR